ncbi:MAG: gamma-glutamylcyclotransferase family protein [Gammaproteobacteria bacterium]|nr:gamma-glutamylcyclotransferase family protein [Gammaproteobacteria bacterium]
MSERLLYFAYGSNLHPERMRRRVPSARPLGCAVLTGHVLRFHKHSLVDGSGKCDAHYTGRAEDRVYGAVYSLVVSEKAALDAVEGPGYEVAERVVTHEGAPLNVFLYRARPDAVDPGIAPYDWYHDLVLAGARHHGLPGPYVARLARVSVRADPDAGRAARERAVLAAEARAGA